MCDASQIYWTSLSSAAALVNKSTVIAQGKHFTWERKQGKSGSLNNASAAPRNENMHVMKQDGNQTLAKLKCRATLAMVNPNVNKTRLKHL